LQNIFEVAKCHGLEPRSTARKKKYESRIPSKATSETSGLKSIYICNDPTGAKIQERAEEHIQTSKPSWTQEADGFIAWKTKLFLRMNTN
jgi:hypothetical protein